MEQREEHGGVALQVQFTRVHDSGLCNNAHCLAVGIAAILAVNHFFCTPSMQYFLKSARPLLSVMALGLVTFPALADSTSSASSASSTSIGSSSASIEKSSNSSSTRDKVAQGQYTVVEMVALAQQPDMLRLRLQPVTQAPAQAVASEFFLLLPRQAAERGQLAVGQVVSAEHRPYGLAFATVAAAGSTATPFFLVLDDAWFGELESRPLGV